MNNTSYSMEKRNSGEEGAVTNWNKNLCLLPLIPFITEYCETSHPSFLKKLGGDGWEGGGGAAMR